MSRAAGPGAGRGDAEGGADSEVAIEGGDATFQFFVDLAEAMVAVELVGADAEAAEDRDQEEGEPELEPPADGSGEAHGDSGLDAVTLSSAGGDQVGSQFFADAEDMHVHEVGERVVGFIEQCS